MFPVLARRRREQDAGVETSLVTMVSLMKA
jgi:hypothetical protein